MPALSPGPRCALTAPFHPCRPGFPGLGGLFSVALSRARNADGWALPTTVPCGVRTFLPVNLSIHRAITQPFQLSCYEIGGFNSTARWGGACAFFFVHPFLSRRALSGDSAVCCAHQASRPASVIRGRISRPPDNRRRRGKRNGFQGSFHCGAPTICAIFFLPDKNGHTRVRLFF